MIITQTPFRISFFGGGTDYKPYFDEYGGSVLSTTFDKYCYVTVRRLLPFFSYKNEITYAKIERTAGVDEIEHPAVREAMKFFGMHNLRIAYEADLPAHSGLGSSSAFAVSLLEALYALQGTQKGKGSRGPGGQDHGRRGRRIPDPLRASGTPEGSQGMSVGPALRAL